MNHFRENHPRQAPNIAKRSGTNTGLRFASDFLLGAMVVTIRLQTK